MPFYGILKTIPHKAGGILCMGLSIAIFLFIPLIYRIKLSIKNNFNKILTQLSQIKFFYNLKYFKYYNNFNYYNNILNHNSIKNILLNNNKIKIIKQLINFFYFKQLIYILKPHSQFIRKIYFIIFFCSLVSLGFFSDL
jgi:hypothetical protein